MKILHVIPGLLNSSGPSYVAKELSGHMSLLGHEVTVIHLTGRGSERQLEFHPLVKILSFPVKWLKYWGYSPELKRYLKDNLHEFDFVHVHSIWLYPNIAVSRLCRKYRIPYAVRPAGSLEPWCMKSFTKKTYLKLIERNILNHAAFIHAVSKLELDTVDSYGFRSPCILVPNGISLRDFRCQDSKSEHREFFRIPGDQSWILYLGRIHPIKNLEFLGRVFSKILDEEAGSQLIIAGPDNHQYASQIKMFFKSLGILGNCTFLGEVRDELKKRILCASDMLVLPSFSENFAIVVLEALASGLPVLASEHTPWEKLNDVSGCAWLPLEEERWLSSMQRKESHLSNPLDYADLVDQYEWNHIAKSLIEKYEYYGIRKH